MTSLLTKRLQALLSILSVLLVLTVIALAVGYWFMRGSVAQLDGERAVAGLSAPVKIERDELGVPLITAATRVDAARALGFLHGQERFFQMDLLSRRAAGELAELFGADAVEMDRLARRHRFRPRAAEVLASMPPEHRTIISAYVDGVNAGLTALARQPWEYYVLRVAPKTWTEEDSLLCVYAMWFDLQDERGHYEFSTQALHDAFGQSGLAFFAPRGTEADSALDGSRFPAPDLPTLRLRREPAPTAAQLFAHEEAVRAGSNNFAVAGSRTASGTALLANDPHLGLDVPNVWYRAAIVWQDEAGETHRVVGSTLPGSPNILIGSNGRVAWGFTNAGIDTVDLVIVETYADIQYRTPQGWRDIDEHEETIAVKGGKPVTITTRWTEFGPLIAPAAEGRYYALRWTAHAPEAVNLELIGLETARDTDEAVAIAHRAGMPNQNLLAVDTRGQIAWTLTGVIPKRVGFDGRLPSSWAYGDRRWNGWLSSDEVPVITNPADGLLWTANNRLVGGEAYAKLGDGGYANGLRASAIEQGLRALATRDQPITEADLLAVQLDDRGAFLDRWQQLAMQTLTDEAVAARAQRREFREFARDWRGHASVDSISYRLIREFRLKVIAHTLAPFRERPQRTYERFNFNQFMTEDAVWRLVNERPERLLNADHATWDALLLAAVDDVIADAGRAGGMKRYTWGARNTLRMRHPFGRFLPGWIAPRVSMRAEPLPGDTNQPRVQTPGFGASLRLVVAPGREEEGIFQMAGGQSGHPLSPFFRAGHDAWAKGEPMPLLPGAAAHTLTLTPQ